MSPDGTEIAYFNIGEHQEDIFIGSSDGKNIHRLTDDAGRDRGPVFTRDGKSLVFYSNRDGGWAIWVIRTDGSNLRKLAEIKPGSTYPVTSPVDDTVVFSATDPGTGVHSIPLAGGRQPSPLPNTKTTSGYFLPTSWSGDGARLCGVLVADSGRASGVAIYDFQTHKITTIASEETFGIRWLPDARRVIYFTQGSHPELV